MTSEAFSCVAINQFATHASSLLREGLGLGPVEVCEFTKFASERLFQRGEDAFPEIGDFLRQTELRDRWNAALGSGRSESLAAWILPHVKGCALDLLCGSGGVGRALEQRGIKTTLVESTDVPAGVDAAGSDTVLICTNLHHEENPEELLAFGAGLARRRLIVIENCIEKDFPAGYQLLVDLFFNRCLNPNDLGSPGTHRTAAGWIHSAAEYGDLVRVERRSDIPGIPLGHHLMVFEVEQRTRGAAA